MPGAILRSSHFRALNLHNHLWSRYYYYYHFAERETEAQRDYVLAQGHMVGVLQRMHFSCVPELQLSP